MNKYNFLVAALMLLFCITSCMEEEIPVNHDLDNTVWIKENKISDEKIYYMEKLIFENGYMNQARYNITGDTLLDVMCRYGYSYDKREGRILYFDPASGTCAGSYQVRGLGTTIITPTHTFLLKGWIKN